MASLCKAIEWLREGKKVRKSQWREGKYFHLSSEGDILSEENSYYDGYRVPLVDLFCENEDSWEIYEEKLHECNKDGFLCREINNGIHTRFLQLKYEWRTVVWCTPVKYCPFCGFTIKNEES